MTHPSGRPALLLPVTPSFRLNGRRALVTGAGRGLGLAIASGLAQAGAHVFVASRTELEILAVAEAMRLAGHMATALLMDVTDTSGTRSILERDAPFDILVNNAGTNRPKPMTETTEDDFDAVLSLNVRGAYFISKCVAGRLQQAGMQGSIVNVTSQMGHVGAANRTVYCAAKHALEGLTKAMAVEYAPLGIRVNSIAPTFIETQLTAPHLQNPEFKRSVLSKIKLGQLGRVEDVMGAVVYLCSDAAALVTGTSLLVDGGWTAE